MITDKAQGWDNLGDAIARAERGVNWDFGIAVGDFSAAFGLPIDEDGEEILRQFDRLEKHRGKDIYKVCGNHDRNPPG